MLVHQYSAWDRPVDAAAALRDGALELVGDGQYVAPLIELAQLHARFGAAQTFLYAFDYVARTGEVSKCIYF